MLTLRSFDTTYMDKLRDGLEPVKFCSVTNVFEFVQKKAQSWSEAQGDLWLWFVDVPWEAFEQLSCKAAGWTYCGETRDLFARIMPSAIHDHAGRLLFSDINHHIISMGLDDVLQPTGAADFSCGSLIKQPDESWDMNTSDGGTARRLVVEVGYSESIGRLILDANWWLRPQSTVELVILLSVARRRKECTLMMYQRSAMSRYDTESVVCTKAHPDVTIGIDDTGEIVVSGQFIIPFSLLVGRQPTGDITLGVNQLAKMGRRILTRHGS